MECITIDTDRQSVRETVCQSPNSSGPGGFMVRWRKLKDVRIEFVFCDSFRSSSARKSIMGPMPKLEDTAHKSYLKKSSNQAPAGTPPYLASLYQTPLLTPEQEYHLFRKMNYLNCRADALREKLTSGPIVEKQVSRLDEMLREAHAVRNQIVQANLRLVVSIARRFVDGSNSFEDLVSEGNVPLIRAVEIFDFTRGYRFSTYATWAVRNTFVRSVPRSRRRSTRYLTGAHQIFEGCSEGRLSQTEYERQERHIVNTVSGLLSHLDNRERKIVMSRFGLDGTGTKKKFREISSQLEISTERVRQIVSRALDKLRVISEANGELVDFHK